MASARVNEWFTIHKGKIVKDSSITNEAKDEQAKYAKVDVEQGARIIKLSYAQAVKTLPKATLTKPINVKKVNVRLVEAKPKPVLKIGFITGKANITFTHSRVKSNLLAIPNMHGRKENRKDIRASNVEGYALCVVDDIAREWALIELENKEDEQQRAEWAIEAIAQQKQRMKSFYLAKQKQLAIESKLLRKHKADIKAKTITKAKEAKIQKKMMAYNDHRLHILCDSTPLETKLIMHYGDAEINKESIQQCITKYPLITLRGEAEKSLCMSGARKSCEGCKKGPDRVTGIEMRDCGCVLCNRCWDNNRPTKKHQGINHQDVTACSRSSSQSSINESTGNNPPYPAMVHCRHCMRNPCVCSCQQETTSFKTGHKHLRDDRIPITPGTQPPAKQIIFEFPETNVPRIAETLPNPRTTVCCLGRDCFIKKSGIAQTRLLDNQRCIIFGNCRCVYHENCYRKSNTDDKRRKYGTDYCPNEQHSNLPENRLYENLTWREIRNRTRDASAESTSQRRSPSKSSSSRTTEAKRGRPMKIQPSGRHPICRECDQLIYYKSDEKYLHGTCYFHKSCYDKWCQRRAHENLPENPCPVHNFIFYPEDYIEQSYPEETATLCNVIGGGNSFQHAIINATRMPSTSVIASVLRHCMYGLLRDIVLRQDLFPRGTFETREEFQQHLLRILTEMDPANEFNVLLEYANHMEPSAGGTKERVSQLNDAILASIFMNRIILIVRPNMEKQRIMDTQPKYNEAKYPRMVLAYFPDGIMMRMQMDRYMNLDNMREFTIREDDRERRVENPIMLWYNGYNHFDAIRFSLRNVAEREGLTKIRYKYQIPASLEEVQTIPSTTTSARVQAPTSTSDVHLPPSTSQESSCEYEQSTSRVNLPQTTSQQPRSIIGKICIHDVAPDGDCMFRAIVMALNRGSRANMMQQDVQQEALRRAAVREMHYQFYRSSPQQLALLAMEIAWDTAGIHFDQNAIGADPDGAPVVRDMDLLVQTLRQYMNNMFQLSRGAPSRYGTGFELRFATTALQRPIVVVYGENDATVVLPNMAEDMYIAFGSLENLYEELHRRNMGNAIVLQQEGLHFKAIYTRNDDAEINDATLHRIADTPDEIRTTEELQHLHQQRRQQRQVAAEHIAVQRQLSRQLSNVSIGESIQTPPGSEESVGPTSAASASTSETRRRDGKTSAATMAQQQKERKARWRQQEEQSSLKKPDQRQATRKQTKDAQILTPAKQQGSTTQQGSTYPGLHQQSQRPMVSYTEALSMPMDELEQLRNEGLVSDELWNMRVSQEEDLEEERLTRSNQYEREEQDRMRVKQDWIDYYREQREHKEKEARKEQQQNEAKEQQARQEKAWHTQQQASTSKQQQTWHQQQPGTSQTQSRQKQRPQQTRTNVSVPQYTYIGGCDYVPYEAATGFTESFYVGEKESCGRQPEETGPQYSREEMERGIPGKPFKEKEVDCHICGHIIHTGDEIAVVQCDCPHKIHRNCYIRAVTNYHNKCPYCRKPFNL